MHLLNNVGLRAARGLGVTVCGLAVTGLRQHCPFLLSITCRTVNNPNSYSNLSFCLALAMSLYVCFFSIRLLVNQFLKNQPALFANPTGNLLINPFRLFWSKKLYPSPPPPPYLSKRSPFHQTHFLFEPDYKLHPSSFSSFSSQTHWTRYWWQLHLTPNPPTHIPSTTSTIHHTPS